MLLSGALVLAVLLFIAPRTAPAAAAQSEATTPADPGLFVKSAESTLSAAEKSAVEKFKSQRAYDSLTAFWSAKRRPEMAAYFGEQSAAARNTAEAWLAAGKRYYNAVQFVKDAQTTATLYQSAMRCANKARSLDPSGIEAVILLGKCYVEGSDKPMEGITLLREAEKRDSLNPDLNLAFAFFSVKSGQLDKAVSRFRKVLRADSSLIEVYLHLADSYEQ
jgi:tetratricopeptide (TPR) repeat protein